MELATRRPPILIAAVVAEALFAVGGFAAAYWIWGQPLSPSLRLFATVAGLLYGTAAAAGAVALWHRHRWVTWTTAAAAGCFLAWYLSALNGGAALLLFFPGLVVPALANFILDTGATAEDDELRRDAVIREFTDRTPSA